MFSLEGFINQALALDARTPARLQALYGKTVEIKIHHLPKSIQLEFTNQGIKFIQDNPQSDVIVQATLKALLSLAIHKNSIEAAKLGLRFEGDVTTAEAIQTLFLSLDIDWEELLSRWTGDSIAHQIGNFIRTTKQRQRDVFNNLQENTRLYLTEEYKLLPTHTEISQFLNDIDALRADVDRIDARIERLYAQSNKGPL